MENINQNIRNFVIIAHIDHGKSTLADRFLEITKTIASNKLQPQYLDRMNLEREHGITIKMHPVQMKWSSNAFPNRKYVLNLIDTPGHVDFTYEVSRSLAAVEGAILLVDGTQGIQAQTLSNFHLAQEQHLKIIGAINKVDLNITDLGQQQKDLADLLKVNPLDILLISAKTGKNNEALLEEVISKIPAPQFQPNNPLRALVFDSVYDDYQGIIAFVRVREGIIRKGDKILLMAKKQIAEVGAVGYFKPQLQEKESLSSGEIGWVATGLKDPQLVRVGDTITLNNKAEAVIPLAGYKEPEPMVFASFYLSKTEQDFEKLKIALEKLKLTDSAIQFTPENSPILGRGYRLGFLGMLHLKITQERLEKNYDLDLIVTNPTVPYRVWIKNSQQVLIITNPTSWPSEDDIIKVEEPWTKVEIVTPAEYLSNIIQLINRLRGREVVSLNFEDRLLVNCYLPLEETIKTFYDQLKSVSQGYASMNYTLAEYQPVDLKKLEVLLVGKEYPSLSRLVIKQDMYREAQNLAHRLKQLIPQQNYSVPIQIKGEGRILARETISARRKDVTAHLYGGDRSRKMKLWQKQKKGKKRLREQANLRLPSNVFLKLFAEH